MKRQVVQALALASAFVILSAGECDIGELGSLLDEPGRISVANIGGQPAVVAILADDVKSYPTLAGGQSGSVQTNTGGRYEVRVVMTPESAANYRAELTSLRSLVEKHISGATDPVEKTRLFLGLAGIKAALQTMSNLDTAGCTGVITLEADTAAEVTATVNWVTTAGGGFWELTCGSS